MVEDRVQDLDSSTCGIFQLYFYDNLFNPDESSKIQGNTTLNKKQLKQYLTRYLFWTIRTKTKMQQYAQDIGVNLAQQLLYEYS